MLPAGGLAGRGPQGRWQRATPAGPPVLRTALDLAKDLAKEINGLGENPSTLSRHFSTTPSRSLAADVRTRLRVCAFYSRVNKRPAIWAREPPRWCHCVKHEGFLRSAAISKQRGGRTRLDLNCGGQLSSYSSDLLRRGAASLRTPSAGGGETPAGSCGPWAHFPG